MTLPNPDFWRGRRVLVTGHTGFKGGWLTLWLARMGATVTGYGLAPEYTGGVFDTAALTGRITHVTADIRHSSVLRECVHLMRPEVVIHLAGAAQGGAARRSAVETYDINVLGTVALLEELRRGRTLRAAVIATSDCYDNDNGGFPFSESNRLGGASPYDASKSAAEFAVAAFRNSNPRFGVATARAGNLIGGGDWGAARLVPDAVRAFNAEEPLQLRAPDSVRPWLYVLDALCGYLLLAERLFEDDPEAASAWNFGAAPEQSLSASELAGLLVGCWGEDGSPAGWAPGAEAEEPTVLRLDCGKAEGHLGWRPRLSMDQAVDATLAWYKAQARGEDMAAFSNRLLDEYLES